MSENSNDMNIVKKPELISEFNIDYFFTKYNWYKEYKKINMKKWSLSDNKEFDSIWMAAQETNFDVMLLDYSESFALPIFAPSLFNTRKYLTTVTNPKKAKKISNDLKKMVEGLDSIWWNHFRPKFEEFHERTINETKSPEYFFCKYYYEFLSSFRIFGILLYTDVILPNFIIANTTNIKGVNNLYGFQEHFDNIFHSIDLFVKITNVCFETCMSSYEKELSEKGKDYVYFDEKKTDWINVIAPNLNVNWNEWIENYRSKILSFE